SAPGAVIRYVISQWWPTPQQFVICTLILALSTFALLGFVLASPAGPDARAFVAGISGARTSVSFYVAIGISQPPWAAIVVLILTPLSTIAAFVGGAMAGVSTTAQRKAVDAPE